MQEKLLILNEEDNLRQMNILRNRAKASAARSVYLAKSIQRNISDRIWSALGEINDYELNLQAAESAWQMARDATQDIGTFLYATRNLAANQMHQHKIPEANRYYHLALDVALHDQASGAALINGLSPDARFAQAVLTHAYWLDESDNKDCFFVVRHYDAALKFIADVFRNGGASSLRVQTQIVVARELLSRFRKPRAACAPPLDAALASADYCLLITNIVDNARTGFSIYKGPANKPKTEFTARVALPEAKLCGINSASNFYCVWAERDEAAVKGHSEMLVGSLMSCLGASKPTESAAGPAPETLPTIDLDFPDRGNIKIKRKHIKPTESSPTPHWDLTLEIDSQH